ncbi:MAG: BatD family protein, partial [Bacteroidota bacterium]
MRPIFKLIILSIWMSFLGRGAMQGQTFTAFADRTEVPVGGTIQVSFKLENAQTRDIEYPNFSGFQVLSGPNTSQSMQIVNGAVTQSLTYSFYLSPSKTGTFNIGTAKAKVQGKSYATKPITIKVVAAGSGGSQGAKGGGANATARNQNIEKELEKSLFLRALVSKRKAYKGEQLTVTYKLYQKVPITNASFEQQPQYDGFWTEKVDVASNTVKNEVYKDVQYQTRILQQDIIFPQKSGKLTIKPMKISCLVRVRNQNRRRPRSIFDSFFEPYSEYEYTFGNQPITINVNDLPSPAPADFNGMVGDFKLDVTVDKTETETGDPITYKVKLSGSGNIKKLPEPQLDFPPDFEVYDPTVSE